MAPRTARGFASRVRMVSTTRRKPPLQCSTCAGGSFITAEKTTLTAALEESNVSTAVNIRCDRCSGAKTSREGSHSCLTCTFGYFMSPGHSECKLCPDGAQCDEEHTTLSTMDVGEGNFRFSTSAAKVYPCPQGEAACVGSRNVGLDGAIISNGTNVSTSNGISTISTIDDGLSAAGASLCAPGYEGALW